MKEAREDEEWERRTWRAWLFEDCRDGLCPGAHEENSAGNGWQVSRHILIGFEGEHDSRQAKPDEAFNAGNEERSSLEQNLGREVSHLSSEQP
jgi:hypothetical protein